MSQIYVPSTSSTPAIPTQFTADDSTIAVPSGNNLDVLSRDTTDNNDNGIKTTANPNLSDNLYIELTNRTTALTTTTDATPTVIYNFPFDGAAGVYSFWGSFQLLDTTTPSGETIDYSAAFRTNGSIAIELGVEFSNNFYENTLTNTGIAVEVNGNSIDFIVIGVSGLTINWNVLIQYRRVI